MTQTVYFGASNGTQGMELWRVDAAGTVSMVADLKPGGMDSAPGNFIAYNGELYFTADTATKAGVGFKITGDGTLVRLMDFDGADLLGASRFAVAGDQLFFDAMGPGGHEPRVIGLDGKVRLLGDLNPAGDSFAEQFTAVGTDVYFTAVTQSGGNELWKYAADGTVTALPEIIAGATDGNPTQLVAFGGTLYFQAKNASVGFELFKLDANGAPVVARDINPHAPSSSPYGLTVFNGELYFQAVTATEGPELWKVASDGTVSSVANLRPGSAGGDPTYLTPFKGSLYFTAYGADGQAEPFRVTSSGTVVPVANINPTTGSGPAFYTVFNNALYFSANDGTHGYEVWKVGSDGAVSMVADINPGSADSSVTQFVATDSGLYFSAISTDAGRELWRIGLDGGAHRLTDLSVGPNWSMSSPFEIGVLSPLPPVTPPAELTPPVITSNGGAPTAALAIAENTSAVTAVTVTDDGSGLHFALSGADAALFAIDAGGSLTFKSAPDFEAPADVGGDNVYDVTVTATDDDGLTDAQLLAITVTDLAGITYGGTKGNNKKGGTLEADTLGGKGGNDTLKGLGGNDTIDGGAGNDKLSGGDGKDKLTGGAGKDAFVFNTSLASAGVDRIVDFSHADDTIQLEGDVFTALGASIASNEFIARAQGHAATKASHHLIYDKAHGSLWYDADGKGVGAATQISQLGTASHHPTDLAVDDFAIV